MNRRIVTSQGSVSSRVQWWWAAIVLLKRQPSGYPGRPAVPRWRSWAYAMVSLLLSAAVLWAALYLGLPPDVAAWHPSWLTFPAVIVPVMLSLIWVAGLVVLYGVGGFLGILWLAATSFHLLRVARSVLTIRRFRMAFGFYPPVTAERRDALQPWIDRIMAERATVLHVVYERERRALEEAILRNEPIVPNVSFTSPEDFEIPSPWFCIKQDARRFFYGAGAVAAARFLPYPFAVREFYKDYLPARRTTA